jgi:tRNA(Met) C34 N-acetyltransferase TmcA
MLVLQDFEALRPNLLARTIETVQGGGMVCILLKTMTSLKQLYTMTMVLLSSTDLISRIFTRDTELTHMKMSFLDSTKDSFYP